MKKCPGSFRAHAQFFLVIVMSNQGTDCFLALLIIAADGFETTEQQEELISFLKDRKAINMIAPGTAGFDLDEMPWQDETWKDDTDFLLCVTTEAQSEDACENFRMR
jgi:hypothetical protein